jgi:hypothetical protein
MNTLTTHGLGGSLVCVMICFSSYYEMLRSMKPFKHEGQVPFKCFSLKR